MKQLNLLGITKTVFTVVFTNTIRSYTHGKWFELHRLELFKTKQTIMEENFTKPLPKELILITNTTYLLNKIIKIVFY